MSTSYVERAAASDRGSYPLLQVPAQKQGHAQGRMQKQGRARRQQELPGIAHDARNVLAALRLYCELLAEPGVLTPEHRHYAAELNAIATASAGLVEQVVGFNPGSGGLAVSQEEDDRQWTDDLGRAVKEAEGLLVAIAGPRIQLEVECMNAPGAVRLSPEDLTRVLTNLVRNAQEAMSDGGRIRITVQQSGGGSFLESGPMPAPQGLLLCVQDTGPGIAPAVLDRIFDSGFSTRARGAQGGRWPGAVRRGLGLSIVRALVEAAGGSVRAVSAPGRGTRFELQFPAGQTFVTGSRRERRVEC